jgi:succinate dehydrogenase/fumarate reductase-like Fe-S protein
MISMRLMGKEYHVPHGLTILTAIEYAGYKLVRGSGCRAGFCGACPTIYRKGNDHKMHTALACQTMVEDGMNLVQIPFVPITRQNYDIEEVAPEPNIVLQYYPEVARCISCNTCSRACPQNMQVMDYIQAALRGDFERASQLSFDCIQCGICSSRCPVDIKHYHVGQLVRRIYGKYIVPPSEHLSQRMEELDAGLYAAELDEMMTMSQAELKQLYEARDLERVAGGDQEKSALRKLGTAMDPVDFQDNLDDLPKRSVPASGS